MPSPSISGSFASLMPSPSVSVPLSLMPSPSGSTSEPLEIPSPSISGSVAFPMPSPSVSASINNVKDSVSVPAALVAVTVYVVAANVPVGVPEINPVVVFKLNPAGKAGAMEYVTILPPVFIVAIEIAELITPLYVALAKLMLGGANV